MNTMLDAYCYQETKAIGFKRRSYADVFKDSWLKEPAINRGLDKDIFIQKYLSARETPKVNVNGQDISLPTALSDFTNLINDSKYILDLQLGWDDHKALPVSANVYNGAIIFLVDYIKYIHDVYAIVISHPDINPVTNNSIDLSWRTSMARMLINVRQNGEGVHAFYYGDLYNNKLQIKGNVPTDSVQSYLASWMTNLK